MRNLRKLKVNADVTFAIWILECFGYFLIVIVWAIGAFLKVDIILEYIIVIYYVMLPHTYLMNTSHNKDRIIDEGLKTIIKNALHIPFDLSVFVNLFRNLDRENRDRIKSNIDANDVERCEKEPDISIVFKKKVQMKNDKLDSDRRLKNSIDVPQVEHDIEKPSSSTGIYEESFKRHLATNPMTDSEDDMTDETTDADLFFSIKKQLLIYMKGNVNNEDHYIHYFLQLIDLESKTKNNDKFDNNFTIRPVVQDEKVQDVKHSTYKNKNKRYINSTDSKKSKSQVEFESNRILSSRGIMLSADEKFDRTLMRIKKLENIDSHCEDEKTFNKLLNELIDFEEGLTKN